MAIVELKSAHEMVVQATQTQAKPAAKPEHQSSTPDYSQFQKMLEQQNQQSVKVMEEIAGIALHGKQASQMKSISAEGLQIDTQKLQNTDQIQTKSQVENIFAELNRGQLQMENVVEMVSSGRRFTGPELLAIQAGMHSIILEMELTAKAVEKVNETHNTVWKTQLA